MKHVNLLHSKRKFVCLRKLTLLKKKFKKKLTAILTNITKDLVLLNDRISPANSQDGDPSLLLNGHFDSPLSSPGAGDCGSCVGGYNEHLLLLPILAGLVHLLVFNFFFFFLSLAASLLEVARVTVDFNVVHLLKM